MHRSSGRWRKAMEAFPNENSLLQLLYMGIENASTRWIHAIARDWEFERCPNFPSILTLGWWSMVLAD